MHIKEQKERWEAMQVVNEKYYVAKDENGLDYSMREWVDSGQTKEIKMIRTLPKGISYEDLGVEIDFDNDENENDFSAQYIFTPQRSAIAREQLEKVIGFNVQNLK